MKPEVLEGDTWASKVALALASSHAIQPAHVDATATPEGSNKHNSIEGVAHPLDVVSSADIEVGSSTLLWEPGIDVGHQAVTALRKRIGRKLLSSYTCFNAPSKVKCTAWFCQNCNLRRCWFNSFCIMPRLFSIFFPLPLLCGKSLTTYFLAWARLESLESQVLQCTLIKEHPK